MRELIREGVRWNVREVESHHVPGARGARCLIFDSDGLVRRAWSFPSNWAELPDDALGSLLEPPPVDRTPAATAERSVAPEPPLRPAASPDVASAAAEAARAQSLLQEAAFSVATTVRSMHQQQALIARCTKVRIELRDVIRQFAWSLRRDGVSPEQAVIRTKCAVRDGLKACIGADDADGDDLVHDGVAWCIEAYYEDAPEL